MPKLFRITPAIRRLAANAIDTMIGELGKDCLLFLPPEKRKCPNCYFDSIQGKSSGKYNGDGPKPFTRPPCPVCRGSGFDPDVMVNTVVVRFLIEWNPKSFLTIQPGIQFPQGTVQTKGFVTDLPLVMQSEKIIIDYHNAKFSSHEFVKKGEPIIQGNIVPSRYFVAFWERSPR